jgi:dTDP-3,4-didehydro-2,6-dideoxy-alpha-D-glucose 3-reductase
MTVTRPRPPVRLGVIGCADIAARRVLPAVSASDRLDLVAVASRDPARAKDFARQFGGEPADSYEALLARSDVDAVYVPLPNALHQPWTEAALRAGKHVLAEKPLTTSLGATLALYRLAESAGLCLTENVMFPHHSQHAAVTRLVADGAIGPVSEFRASFVVPARPAGDVRLAASLGGGALLDGACYPVRAAQYHLGRCLEMVGAVLRMDRSLGVDVAGWALLRTPGGATAQLAWGLDGSYRTEYELCGPGGRLLLERAFSPSASLCPVLVRVAADGSVSHHQLPADDQVRNAVEAFAGAVAGQADPESATASRAQAAVLDQIRASAERVAA